MPADIGIRVLKLIVHAHIVRSLPDAIPEHRHKRRLDGLKILIRHKSSGGDGGKGEAESRTAQKHLCGVEVMHRLDCASSFVRMQLSAGLSLSGFCNIYLYLLYYQNYQRGKSLPSLSFMLCGRATSFRAAIPVLRSERFDPTAANRIQHNRYCAAVLFLYYLTVPALLLSLCLLEF